MNKRPSLMVLFGSVHRIPSSGRYNRSGSTASLPGRNPPIGQLWMASKRHWRGNFYPARLSATRWLEHYATHFDTVEINNTFYRPPRPILCAVARRAPSSFVYAVKASRYLTHLKKLKDPVSPVTLFFSRARKLGRRLGPVLYQLPPHWPRNLERLETFLKTVPTRRLHAMSSGIRAGIAMGRLSC